MKKMQMKRKNGRFYYGALAAILAAGMLMTGCGNTAGVGQSAGAVNGAEGTVESSTVIMSSAAKNSSTTKTVSEATILDTSKLFSNRDLEVGYDESECVKITLNGDTAQVGPQVAQKLGLNQVTYVEDVKEVKEDKGVKKAVVQRIIDGGVVDIGLESTIADLTGSEPMILRPGAITVDDIAAVTGAAGLDPGIGAADDRRPRAPGMRYRHYAPAADMMIFRGEAEAVAAEIKRRAADVKKQGKRVGIIASEETAGMYPQDLVHIVGTRECPDIIAHNLYRLLRDLDTDGIEIIFSEFFAGDGIGAAVSNRLTKAAGGQITEV